MHTTNYLPQLNGYIVGKTLGKGTFGKVKKAVHKLTNEPVAIKFLQKNKIKDITDVQRVSRQLYFLKIARHSAIAQLYEVIETPKMIYLVMEFATGGEYFDYVMDQKIKNQEQAFVYFSQIVSALIYLHKLKICHRDVKPENMLLDTNKRIKLVDFGLSNMYKNGEKLDTACGSPCYASPQMIKGQSYDPQLTDIWSLGIVLYTSIMAQLPFEDENTNVLYSKIKSGLYIIDKKISPELKDLMSKMINVKPQNRIRLQKLLQHPWYKKFDKKRLFSGIKIGYEDIPIDENVVQQMRQLGFQKRKTLKYLQNNIKNECTTTYYLLLKKNFRFGKSSTMDICSQNYENLGINKSNKCRNRNHKSLDIQRLLQIEEQSTQVKILKRNSMSQTKKYYYEFQSCKKHNFKQIKMGQSRKNSIVINKKKSIESFLKTRAELQVKRGRYQSIKKLEEIRNKSLSVSSDKSKQLKLYLSQMNSSKKKIKLSVQNKKQKLMDKRIKTDFISDVYCPSRKISKQLNHGLKQKVKTKIQNIDVNDVFWRKKSTNLKNNSINSSQFTKGIRKSIYC